ncbi:MAG: hypothetical protein E6R07_04385 [Nevskiaceae bacterium]|nr:MAG: hypothetical protein E6R07_04385 [Nevskiaceae bacterium]
MNRHPHRAARCVIAAMALCALLSSALAHAADNDPPDRVARLAYLAGAVSYAPAGTDGWDQVGLNRPLIAGDRLLTGDDARLALDTGSNGEIRLGGESSFRVLRLDASGTQIELSRGTLNWRVLTLVAGQSLEIDTPTLALVFTQPGALRLDVAPDGASTIVSLFEGAATVYGRNGASYSLSGRQSWRFDDPQLQHISGMPLSPPDDFDRWCSERDQRLFAPPPQYVSTQVVGYSDLDVYGDWDSVDDYGPVWYPRTVVVGWAPYRYGHWAWIPPWGWTWIDDAPWGFAPFHYGRWVYVRERWGWVPGPVHERPVYCPALVAFVGGSGWHVSASSGAPIGWVPLGPRDVYTPWYRGSHRYFERVNASNSVRIDRQRIDVAYDDFHHHRTPRLPYTHQALPGAATAVTHEDFAQGRPVGTARMPIDRTQLTQAPALPRSQLPHGRPGAGLAPAVDAPQSAPAAAFKPPLISRRPLPPVIQRPADAGPRRDGVWLHDAPVPHPATPGDDRGPPLEGDVARQRGPGAGMPDRHPQPLPRPGEPPSSRDDSRDGPAPPRPAAAPATPDGEPGFMPRPQPRPLRPTTPRYRSFDDAQRPPQEPRPQLPAAPEQMQPRGPERPAARPPEHREPPQRREPEPRERPHRERD